jgi:urease accessory protein
MSAHSVTAPNGYSTPLSVVAPSSGVNLSIVRLLQVCSPAFPIGAFAYSQGLEQAVEVGWVTEPAHLQEWLCGMLTHSLAHTELPLLRQAYEQWQPRATGSAAGRSEPSPALLCHRVLAYRETAELRAEERHLGRSLARLLAHLGVSEATPFIEHEDASYLVLFALAAVHFGIAPSDMLAGFAFAWAENQVSAASRLMKLGQLAAQAALSEFVLRIPDAVNGSFAVADDEIGFSPPGLFLASAWHEEQYSRIFRS